MIHELSHIVFWKTGEKFITQIEQILIALALLEQKTFEIVHPHQEVKNNPFSDGVLIFRQKRYWT